MKNFLLITAFASLVFFVDYIIIALIGGIAKLFGAGDEFYCGAFCYVAISVLVISVILSLYPVLRKNLHLHR
ncbi:MAG: hypothetical protein AB9842_10180 [Bacteroidales bacterium]